MTKVKVRIRIEFWYNDGTRKTMIIEAPREVGDKIAVSGLAGARVYVEGNVTSFNTLKKPELSDFYENSH